MLQGTGGYWRLHHIIREQKVQVKSSIMTQVVQIQEPHVQTLKKSILS